jgi:ABC-type oligopeptide transport system substrate-binding subunit
MWKEVLGIDSEVYPEEYRVFLQTRRDETRWEVARLAWTADSQRRRELLEASERTILADYPIVPDKKLLFPFR